jgi:hypothetical protein
MKNFKFSKILNFLTILSQKFPFALLDKMVLKNSSLTAVFRVIKTLENAK